MGKKKRRKKRAASGRKQPHALKISMDIPKGDTNDLIEKYYRHRDIHVGIITHQDNI